MKFIAASGATSNTVVIEVQVIDVEMTMWPIGEPGVAKTNPPEGILFMRDPELPTGDAFLGIALKFSGPEDLPDLKDELRWGISPLPLLDGTGVEGTEIIGTFQDSQVNTDHHSFGNLAAVRNGSDALPLLPLREFGVRSYQVIVGLGKDTDAGIDIENVTNVMQLHVLKPVLESQGDEFGEIDAVLPNDDFDEGKKDGAGKPVPDNADASPLNAAGTAIVLDDMAPLDIQVLPDTAEFLALAEAKLTKTAGDVRIIAVRPGGTTNDDWTEVPFNVDLIPDFFAPDGQFHGFEFFLEGLALGIWTVNLPDRVGDTTRQIFRTLPPRV